MGGALIHYLPPTWSNFSSDFWVLLVFHTMGKTHFYFSTTVSVKVWLGLIRNNILTSELEYFARCHVSAKTHFFFSQDSLLANCFVKG